MSWGYFIELDVSLPTATWKSIARKPASGWPAEPGFFRLKEKGLESMFLAAEVADWTFERTIATLADWEAISSVSADGDRTKIRVATLLDKSGETYFARPIASLFLAALALGGEGRIALVNDGTYSGEDGVVLTIEKNKIKHARIDDAWPHVERLGAEIYGTEIFDLEEPKPVEKKTAAKKKKKAPAKRKKSVPKKKKRS